MKLTVFLILLNIILFFISYLNFDYFLENFAFSKKDFLSGKYYQAITTHYLHADILHLASNMLALLLLGSTVESRVSKLKYFLVYTLAGIAAAFVTFLPIFNYSETEKFLGASASISGLIGLGTFIAPRKITLSFFIIPLPFMLVGAIYFILDSSNIFSPSEIAFLGHVAGFLTGAAFGLAWGENRLKRFILFILLVLLIISLPYLIPLILRLL